MRERTPLKPLALAEETVKRIKELTAQVEEQLVKDGMSDNTRINNVLSHFFLMVDVINSFTVQSTGRYYELVCLHRMKKPKGM